ncbi:S-adenosyl-L-methionine-dependent methyltransferase [Stipitochalara longipes BDJ]|nr:S-adenosyl-L-methionine-dependent methyltransferase [Stipitochalara longipes BDJ]
MGSVTEPSVLEVLLKRVSLQAQNGVKDVVNDKNARETLLASTRQLTLALEAPDDVVNSVVFFPSSYMCSRVAIDLKLFDIIADAKRPISSAELASKTEAEEQLLVRILRGITFAGLVNEVGEQLYEANAATHHVKLPSVQAGMIHFYDQGLKSVWSIPEYFKSNGYKLPSDAAAGPFQFAFDTPLETYSYWATKPAVADNFNTFMAGKLNATKTGQSWDESYPVKERLIDGFDASISDALFVDIAGGRGHEVGQLKIRFPEAPGRFILEDLPAVIDDTKELDNSIERIKYDFFQSQPVKGSRTYFMANIMHNWPDEDCRKIIKNVAQVMVKGYSRLLLSDDIVPETNCSLRTFGRDIGMLSLHSGSQRSEKQWTALLEPVGLKIVKFWYFAKGEGLIEAVLKD